MAAVWLQVAISLWIAAAGPPASFGVPPAPAGEPSSHPRPGVITWIESGPDAPNHVANSSADRLVYSNTLGDTTLSFGTGLVGDDLFLTSAPGCLLSRFSFEVDAGGDDPFTVSFALYDECPRVAGTIIPGTQGEAELPGGGRHWVHFEPPPEAEIPLPDQIWIGISLSDPSAGWVGGAPALRGTTDDVWADPFFGGCSGRLGGDFPPGPYSGFNVAVYVREPCNGSFFGYRAAPELTAFLSSAGDQFAEDIALNVDDCLLTAYEVPIRGFGEFRFDLRRPDAEGLPGETIPKTELAYTVASNAVRFARKDFDPPIPVPERLWIGMHHVKGFASVRFARAPSDIGLSEPTVAFFEEDQWVLREPDNVPVEAVLHVTMVCAGEAPTGACCDMFQLDPAGDAVCREIPEINCVFPPRGSDLLPQWMEGASCQPDPFDPPCGAAACCRPHGVCEDISGPDCIANGVSWTRGVYCEGLDEPCEFVCVPSFESCLTPHEGTGCKDPFCCREVCVIAGDEFCCKFEWDSVCVDLAELRCAVTPTNDECAPQGELLGAAAVPVPGSEHRNSLHATESESDPGFCCHAGAAGAKGLGTVWYKFTATGTSAEVSTCSSSSPATDSLIQVFAAPSGDSEAERCASLEFLACNDDHTSCGRHPQNSRLCVEGLVPGETYYVMVAATSQETLGVYTVNIDDACTIDPPETCPCPLGTAELVAPPDGAVDARRPHPPGDPANPAGIAELAVQAPAGADRVECWAACESTPIGSEPQVVDVVRSALGFMTVILDRPIAAGAAARVTYTDDTPLVSGGSFVFHPGNVNGDALSDAADVLTLIDVLAGDIAAPWGTLSTDIDRTGTTTPLDILQAIDLLNGAEAFPAFNGTPRPTPPPTCP